MYTYIVSAFICFAGLPGIAKGTIATDIPKTKTAACLTQLPTEEPGLEQPTFLRKAQSACQLISYVEEVKQKERVKRSEEERKRELVEYDKDPKKHIRESNNSGYFPGYNGSNNFFCIYGNDDVHYEQISYNPGRNHMDF